MDVARLEAMLGHIAQDGARFVPLRELVDSLRTGDRLSGRPVAVTVDDGYRDFANLAAEVFGRAGCPVTVFLSTGFVDGTGWHWWDKVEWAARRSSVPTAEVTIGERTLHLDLTDDHGIHRTVHRVWEALKKVEAPVMEAAVEGIAATLELDLPTDPPAEYAPMDWDTVRSLEGNGISFGPHTVTHPILSRVGDERANREITASWNRLEQELGDPVPVLAYPNGQKADFGPREEGMARAAGLTAAVSTIPGFVGPGTREAPYRVPRIALPADAGAFRMLAAGWTRLAATKPWRVG